MDEAALEKRIGIKGYWYRGPTDVDEAALEKRSV